jgi:hypothetical protein
VPEVLQLFLQQPSTATSNSTAVFKLLATSNTMRAAIENIFNGQLSLAYISKDPNERSYYLPLSQRKRAQKSLFAWLRQHGHLLRALHIQDVVCGFEQLLAAALRDAAASPKGLHLQSFDSDYDNSNSLAVIKALPAHSLTHLRVCMTEPMPEDGTDWDQIATLDAQDQYDVEEYLAEKQMEVSMWLETHGQAAAGPPAASELCKT